jgi:hypothetical protein
MDMQIARGVAGLAMAAVIVASAPARAQSPIPAEFQGDWVAASATCESLVRFRVAPLTLSLINGTDTQSWSNVALPTSFFGPAYTGMSVVALPDFDGSQPFTAFFNADEKKGVARLEIYFEMKGNLNPAVAKIQAAAKQLAARFPLNNVPLKKC